MVPPLVLLVRQNKHGRGFQVWIVGLGARDLVVVFLWGPRQVAVGVEREIFVVQGSPSGVRDGAQVCRGRVGRSHEGKPPIRKGLRERNGDQGTNADPKNQIEIQCPRGQPCHIRSGRAFTPFGGPDPEEIQIQFFERLDYTSTSPVILS